MVEILYPNPSSNPPPFPIPARPFYLDKLPDNQFPHRVGPSKPDGKSLRILPLSIVAQLHLYRWARSIDFVPFPNNAELLPLLPQWNLHPSSVSRAIIYALGSGTMRSYKIVNFLNEEKGTMTSTSFYNFAVWQRLAYGLEWQIAEWLHQILAPGEDLVQSFDEIAECSERDLKGLYIDPHYELYSSGRLQMTDEYLFHLWANEQEEHLRMQLKPNEQAKRRAIEALRHRLHRATP